MSIDSVFSPVPPIVFRRHCYEGIARFVGSVSVRRVHQEIAPVATVPMVLLTLPLDCGLWRFVAASRFVSAALLHVRGRLYKYKHCQTKAYLVGDSRNKGFVGCDSSGLVPV